MDTIRKNKIVRRSRLMIQAGTIVLLACSGLAGATQQYEGLRISVDEFISEIEVSAIQDSCTKDVCIVLRSLEPNDLSRILALVDALEYRVERKLTIAAADEDDGGNIAAGTRVRKQMQKVKQAAQLVRNRVLEIRSAT